MGTEGSDSGFIRSANATSITAGTGFYMNVGGSARFGQAVSPGNNYIYFNGSSLEVSGVLKATSGNIGGWIIGSNTLKNSLI